MNFPQHHVSQIMFVELQGIVQLVSCLNTRPQSTKKKKKWLQIPSVKQQPKSNPQQLAKRNREHPLSSENLPAKPSPANCWNEFCIRSHAPLGTEKGNIGCFKPRHEAMTSQGGEEHGPVPLFECAWFEGISRFGRLTGTLQFSLRQNAYSSNEHGLLSTQEEWISSSTTPIPSSRRHSEACLPLISSGLASRTAKYVCCLWTRDILEREMLTQ